MFLSKGQFNQFLAGLTASVVSLSGGMGSSWTSLTVPTWMSAESPVPMTVEQSSWIVSSISIGSLVGAILSGVITNKVGRKNLLLAGSPMLIISWLLVIATRSVATLCLARFLQGLSIGFSFTISPLYLGEIADVEIRGFIGTLYLGLFYVGVLTEYVAGYFLPLHLVPYFNLIFPIVFLLVFLNMPESPYFLMMKHDKEGAVKALEWLRASKPQVKVQEEMVSIEKSAIISEDSKGYGDLFSTCQARKALMIVMTTAFVRIFNGSAALTSLASYIFIKTESSFLTPGTFPILVGLLQLIGFLLCAPSVDYLGRRFLLLWSTVFCGICQLAVAAYFYLDLSKDVPVRKVAWVIPILLLLFIFFKSVGTGSLIGVLKIELVALHSRGLVSTMAGIAGTVSEFSSLKSYQVITAYAGIYWNHFLFSITCAFGVFIYARFLPETKGLTFDDIQIRLRGDKNRT